MYCAECGNSIDDGDDFCAECGVPQETGTRGRSGAMGYDELLVQRAALWSSVDTIQKSRLRVSAAESKHGSVVTVVPPIELGGGSPLAELRATVTAIDARAAEIDRAQADISRHRQAITALEAKSKNVRMVVIGSLVAVPVLFLVLVVILIGAVS